MHSREELLLQDLLEQWIGYPLGDVSSRVRAVGRTFAVGVPPLTHISTVLTPPASAAQNLGVAFGGPDAERRMAACLKRWRALPLRGLRQFNENIRAGSVRFFNFFGDYKSGKEGGGGGSTQHHAGHFIIYRLA
jgi:hypothetical protein